MRNIIQERLRSKEIFKCANSRLLYQRTCSVILAQVDQ